jgi:hypothetical protein
MHGPGHAEVGAIEAAGVDLDQHPRALRLGFRSRKLSAVGAVDRLRVAFPLFFAGALAEVYVIAKRRPVSEAKQSIPSFGARGIASLRSRTGRVRKPVARGHLFRG